MNRTIQWIAADFAALMITSLCFTAPLPECQNIAQSTPDGWQRVTALFEDITFLLPPGLTSKARGDISPHGGEWWSGLEMDVQLHYGMWGEPYGTKGICRMRITDLPIDIVHRIEGETGTIRAWIQTEGLVYPMLTVWVDSQNDVAVAHQIIGSIRWHRQEIYDFSSHKLNDSAALDPRSNIE